MHKNVKLFVKNVKSQFPDMFRNKFVLDFGSLYINGNVTEFFNNCIYTGIDIVPGYNVDIVCKAHDFKYSQKVNNLFNSQGQADVCISFEMLEHDKYWKQSLKNMYSLLRRDGLMIVTCATTGRAPHGITNASPNDSPATNDYYRNISLNDFRFTFFPLFKYFRFYNLTTVNNDLQFYGFKK